MNGAPLTWGCTSPGLEIRSSRGRLRIVRVLIVGCGYTGTALGSALACEGHDVVGLRRSGAAGGDLDQAGIRPAIADITRAESLPSVGAEFDWVVNCAASGRGGGEDAYRRVYLEGTRNLLDWLTKNPPAKYVWIGSTGVYGQNDGSVVSEESPTRPTVPTARILVETERVLLDAYHHRGFPAVILRSAGIYGPGRGYWLKQFLAATVRIEGDGSRIINLIHLDDLVGAIAAALREGRPGAVYNVVDDEPTPQIALLRWLARTLKKPVPPGVPADAVVGKRGLSSKRVSNAKLRAELGYSCKYPTFREGFLAEPRP